MSKINNVFVFLNLTLFALTLGAYLAPYIAPNDSFLFPLLGLGFPALLMANLAFILYWLLFKPKYSLGSILLLLLGIFPIMNIINIQPAAKADKAATTLQIASYNMQFSKPVRLGNKAHKQKMDEAFRKYLAQLKDIDILCLQEHSAFAEQRIDKHLSFPYKYFSKRKYVAIYSKYPIINKGTINKFGSNIANTCIWADINIKGKKIRVYSAHFEANRQHGKVPSKIVETTKEPPVSTSIALGLLRHYQQFSAKRATQAKRLRAIMKKSPYPTILCGDMNDTPQSHVYRLLEKDRLDTFREKGFGLGATFGSTFKNKLALLRIDYIFTPLSFNILDHQIIQAPYSDHYLIHSKMQLP